jgi:hypothetical protein
MIRSNVRKKDEISMKGKLAIIELYIGLPTEYSYSRRR